MTEHNAIDTRVAARPLWLTFLLLLITSGLYRTYWAWRVTTDLVEFTRERSGAIGMRHAIKANPGGLAFSTFLLLPAAPVMLFGLLLATSTVPAEYGYELPTDGEIATMIVIGAAGVIAGIIAQLRIARHVGAARTLAGLEATVSGTGRAFVPLLALEVVAVPASMFALQHSLNDLWSRYPPLLDEDLHGELATEARRAEAIALRPHLHEERLRQVATELDRPGLIPWVTIAFAATCVLAFVVQLWAHGPFPDTRDIERIGGLREGLDGQWWRFWVANVLHVGFEHLTGNMLVWVVIGSMVERAVGPARTIALILIGAAGCSIGALVAHPEEVGVGASGVVFAAFGMAAMLDPLARRPIGKLGWSLVAFGLGLSTFAPGISSGGHVGGVMAGFAMGAFVTFVWRVRRPVTTAGDRAARRRPPLDRSAPLAANRELTIEQRLQHLDRRRDAGELDPWEHDRLRRALVTRG